MRWEKRIKEQRKQERKEERQRIRLKKLIEGRSHTTKADFIRKWRNEHGY